MLYMLCRNRVQGFEKWQKVFNSHSNDLKKVGLYLTDM